jgi:WD40 repeat protein
MKWYSKMFLLVVATGLSGAEPEGPKDRPAIAIAEIKRSDAIDFEREILPILKDNCLACHNQTKAKADLILETPQTILKGGESGPAVRPGKSAESLLLKLAAHQEKPGMPPRENKVAAANLTPEQLGLVKLWIDQGAKGEVRALAPVEWQSVPDALNPIFAVALSQDGQLAACSRGNQIFVYHVPSRQLITRLADPNITNDAGVAHRDLVQSLAFNPDGTVLASGSYREVKLWRRPKDVKAFQISASNSINAVAVSPDGKWLAVAEASGTIRLHELPSGKEVKAFAGHEQAVTALRFSTNSSRLCSGSSDKTIRLWNVADGAVVIATNIPAGVNGVAWLSSDQIGSAHGDNVIRVWRVSETNGLVLHKELKGHEGAVTALETVPKANQLLSGSLDGTVRQWDIEKGEAIRVLKHEGAVLSVAVRPDGKRFASAGTNNIARLWNAEDGKPIADVKGDRYAQEAAAESERTLGIAVAEVAYRKSNVEAAEKQNQTQAERLKKGEEAFAAADKAFNEKKQALATATESKTTAEKSLADLNSQIKKATDEFTEADKAARLAASEAKAAADKATQTKLAADQAAQTRIETEKVASDAALIASRTKAAAGTNTAPPMALEADAVAAKVRAFADSVAAEAAARVKAAEEAKAAAERAIDAVAARFFSAGQLRVPYEQATNTGPQRVKEATDKLTSATNAFVAAEKEFKKSELTRSTTENELQLAKSAAAQSGAALAAAKTSLQTAEQDHKAKEAILQAAKKAATESEKVVRALAFSSDNLTLATSGDDQVMHTWNADSGAAFEVYRAHTGSVASIAFASPAHIISGGADGNLIMWNLNPPWALERVLGTGDSASAIVDRVMAVRFSRDGQRLATGSGEPSRSGEIKIWQLSDGKLLSDLKSVHSDSVLSLDFSPDDKYLASGAADKFARVIELASGKVVKAFEGHTHHVLGVSWKRDGRSLATAGADNVVKVWDFTTGERKKNIEGFSKEVASISFIGATDQALTSSGDSQVRIVRENGESVRTFGGATDYMYSASATPDGKVIVAGGQDSVLRVWNGGDGNVVATFPAPKK